MKKTLWTLLLFGVSSAIKGLRTNQGGQMELTRLKMSLLYVKSIKTFRLLFMSLLSMGVCLVLLLVGLILFYVSLFLYAPWSMETKMVMGLLSSVVYVLAAFVMFSQTFASDKWIKIFHADALIGRLPKEAVQNDAVMPTE